MIGAGEVVAGVVQPRPIEIEQRDLGTLPGKGPRGGEADAGGRAGDDDAARSGAGGRRIRWESQRVASRRSGDDKFATFARQ